MKIVKEENWKNYLYKAEQFKNTAEDAFAQKSWNSVGLNTVHAAISANDALIVHASGIRSASDNHNDAVSLLIKTFNNTEEVKDNAKHLSWLINRKNLIEYESRLFYEHEASDALKHAERFLNWAKSKLPK